MSGRSIGWIVVGLLIVAALVGACSKKYTNPQPQPSPPPGGDPNLFDSGILSGGGAGTFSHQFTGSAEVVHYICSLHSGMHGWVNVKAGGPATNSVSIVSTVAGFSPD